MPAASYLRTVQPHEPDATRRKRASAICTAHLSHCPFPTNRNKPQTHTKSPSTVNSNNHHTPPQAKMHLLPLAIIFTTHAAATTFIAYTGPCANTGTQVAHIDFDAAAKNNVDFGCTTLPGGPGQSMAFTGKPPKGGTPSICVGYAYSDNQCSVNAVGLSVVNEISCRGYDGVKSIKVLC
ncbi:hypothetical protein EJ03DRAFT_328813 [Teratosphaeria nubilosa]|uniref:Uncharacterized protein n=1 Tax=Teratosphaeria nubilosa TaxID=161662 RepID=A0A6G1L5D3_9PEZI|nr:hypothetical protein EJ03DRAFT_328813 [Teratosphaeria nubilosa]